MIMADTQVIAPTVARFKLPELRSGTKLSSNIDVSSNNSPDSAVSNNSITVLHLRQFLQEGIAPDSQNLILPPGLLDDVANAIWKMAVDEPCGFRGCVLNIVLCNDHSDSDPKKRRPLLQLKNDNLITHKITILLYPDTNSWFTKMARIFRPRHTAVASHFSSEVTRMCCFD